MTNINIIEKALKLNEFNIKKTFTYLNGEVAQSVLKERLKSVIKYQKTLKNLLHIPKIEQKTDEWYKVRQNLITASDFAQALGEGKFGTAKQLIQKKCEVSNESEASWNNQIMKWGNMFEDVAVSIYENMTNMDVHTFGLIKHPNRSYFGASPDGISDIGIMVEIKCPFKRKITGEIPLQYYYQIQGQLDVCGLDECDYFECEFGTYDTKEEFIENKENSLYRGIIVEKEGNKFIYSTLNTVNNNYVNNFLINNTDKGEKIVFWYLRNYNMKRVIKDEKFVKEKLDQLEDVWNKILYYRQNPDKYEVEVKNTIYIDTEVFQKKSKISQEMKGYRFVDLE